MLDSEYLTPIIGRIFAITFCALAISFALRGFWAALAMVFRKRFWWVTTLPFLGGGAWLSWRLMELFALELVELSRPDWEPVARYIEAAGGIKSVAGEAFGMVVVSLLWAVSVMVMVAPIFILFRSSGSKSPAISRGSQV